MVVVLVLIQPVITLWFLELERLSTLSLEVVDEEKVHILVGTNAGYSKGGEGGQRQHNSSYTALQTYTIVVGGGAQGWTSSTNHSGSKFKWIWCYC